MNLLLAEKSLYEFVRQAWPHAESADLIDNWHLRAVCDHLQAVTEGTITQLVINIPPGCSKSLVTCVFWPAWEWATYPEIRWFFASYDQRLSTRDSVRCRSLLSSRWFRERWGRGLEFRGDQNLKTYYENTAGGYRLATSVGGHGTGEHPDRIVVDDPQDADGARSPAERKAVHEWWDQTMTTRGASRQARRVIIMQRLHREDLSGHVLEQQGWDHLCLPMRYDPARHCRTSLGWSDPRTEPGQLLTPRQFPPEMVARLAENLGTYGVSGQFQQDPAPEGGSEWPADYFGPHVWFDEWPSDLILKVLALDPSKGKRDKFGDYSAYVWIGLDRDLTLWVDADLERRNVTRIVEDGIAHCQRWRPNAFVVEINGFQELLGSEFHRMATERRIQLPMYGINNSVNKEVRIRTLTPYLAQRRIRFKGGSPGARLLVQQMRDFPVGEHDDGPDALEMGVRMLDWLLGNRGMGNQPAALSPA